MKTFLLKRLEDVSGVSGKGIVAEGTQYSNGKCTLAWMTKHQSVAVYDSIEDVQKIHGHDGKTIIVWLDNPKENCIKCLAHYQISSFLQRYPYPFKRFI